jgi:hypothetical protein
VAEAKPGYRARITKTWEGVVRPYEVEGYLAIEDGPVLYVGPDQTGSVEVEILEPGYEPLAYYQDALGHVYRWFRSDPSFWRCARTGNARHMDWPIRPLVKLVPEKRDV